MGLELVKATTENAAWTEIRYAGVVDWWSSGRELSAAETGENNTSTRIEHRGTISQCRQRSAGAKWQAVEDQRGEDQRDRRRRGEGARRRGGAHGVKTSAAVRRPADDCENTRHRS